MMKAASLVWARAGEKSGAWRSDVGLGHNRLGVVGSIIDPISVVGSSVVVGSSIDPFSPRNSSTLRNGLRN